MALFTKLRIKVLYSTAYHPQTDGSSEYTNQIIEIALRFFVHALVDSFYWPEVLPHIPSILNNISSFTTGETLSKIAYGFAPRRPLDLIFPFSLPDTYVAGNDVADTIFFALANQKAYYNKKYQPLFMKVGDWAMLRLHKSYTILSLAGVIKKLIQQYVSPFQIKEKVRRLAYRLEIPSNCRIYLVFLVVQLESTPKPSNNSFWRFHLHHPPNM